MNATPEPTIAIMAILVTTAILVSLALIAVRLIFGKSNGARPLAAFMGIFVFMGAILMVYLTPGTPTRITHGDHNEPIQVSVDAPRLPPIPSFPGLMRFNNDEFLQEPTFSSGRSQFFTSLLAMGGTFLILKHVAGRYDNGPTNAEQHPG